MIANILVPLDGSLLAENALPAAACLAQSLKTRVTLLHVIERNAPAQVHNERHLTDAAEAQKYLQVVAAKWFAPSTQVDCHVHTDQVRDVAASIVEHKGELAYDLIVMSTHGRSGLRRWVFGSIAQQVVSLGTIPLLMIPPDHPFEADDFARRPILVPLDGQHGHEVSLPLAGQLARVCGASLQLLGVVHQMRDLPGEQAAAARMLPGTMTLLLNMEEHKTQEYLQKLVDDLERGGIGAGGVVRRGDPVKTILAVAQELSAQLIVLATHGKTGSQAFWAGSVAARVALKAASPLLLVPIA